MAARLHLKVVPRAVRTEFAGRHGDRLRMRVASVPEGGRANAAIVEFLAEWLNVPKRAVAIVAGHGSTLKTVEVTSIGQQELDARLPD